MSTQKSRVRSGLAPGTTARGVAARPVAEQAPGSELYAAATAERADGVVATMRQQDAEGERQRVSWRAAVVGINLSVKGRIRSSQHRAVSIKKECHPALRENVDCIKFVQNRPPKAAVYPAAGWSGEGL
ncbi:hypothetical protein [Silvimonas iriomotensis]|uniref:hypothetical protein n=1 Tax=Silvimonas iriomotensis TaxID=449662 RepID=UPI001669D34A|nr:hypothetical protein [Silvimonas iriomotensis]